MVLPLPFQYTYLLVLFLIALVGTSKTWLNINNKNSKIRQSFLIFVSRVSPLHLILVISFHKRSFIMLRIYSLPVYCNKFRFEDNEFEKSGNILLEMSN